MCGAFRFFRAEMFGYPGKFGCVGNWFGGAAIVIGTSYCAVERVAEVVAQVVHVLCEFARHLWSAKRG